MKSRIVIFITVCSILLSGNILAKNMDQERQNHGSEVVEVAQENPTSNDINSGVPFPTIDFIILIAIGFIFARKHQSLAKKQLKLLKKNKNKPSLNSDSIIYH